jgi:hypothetical protein
MVDDHLPPLTILARPDGAGLLCLLPSDEPCPQKRGDSRWCIASRVRVCPVASAARHTRGSFVRRIQVPKPRAGFKEETIARALWPELDRWSRDPSTVLFEGGFGRARANHCCRTGSTQKARDVTAPSGFPTLSNLLLQLYYSPSGYFLFL